MQHDRLSSDHARIRRIFNERHDTYTLVEAARLTDVSIGALKRAIDAGEIEALPTCSGTHVLPWPSLVALAFDRWPQETIEEAIGKRAASELPRLGRLRTARFLLPEYQLRLIETLAGDEAIDCSTFLERHLLDLVSSVDAHAIEKRIPGFEAALLFTAE